MNRPVDKITVLSRGKKGSKQHSQKCAVGSISTTSESAAKNSVTTSSSKENISPELPSVYDGSHVETLMSEEKTKHTSFASITPTTPDYDLLKTSNGEVDFGGGHCEEFHTTLPRIVDLCLEDKKRILQLINELANCKEEKEMMTKELNSLKEVVQDQMNELAVTNEKFATQKEALALEVESLVTSRDNLSSDLENLQNCVEIQKNEIEKHASLIATLKAEKKHLQKQLLEQGNKLKAALSNVDILTEKLLFYEPRMKMKNEYGQAASPREIDTQMTSKMNIHQGEIHQYVQSSESKVEGCSGDAGTHILQDSMSCSASTDVGFFAVRMCPDLGSGTALVVCRPTEQMMTRQ